MLSAKGEFLHLALSKSLNYMFDLICSLILMLIGFKTQIPFKTKAYINPNDISRRCHSLSVRKLMKRKSKWRKNN